MIIILKLFGNQKIDHAYFGIVSSFCMILLFIGYDLWCIEYYDELLSYHHNIMYYTVT